MSLQATVRPPAGEQAGVGNVRLARSSASVELESGASNRSVRKSPIVLFAGSADLAIGACTSLAGLTTPIGDTGIGKDIRIIDVQSGLEDAALNSQASAAGRHVSSHTAAVLFDTLPGQGMFPVAEAALQCSALSPPAFRISIPSRPLTTEGIVMACRARGHGSNGNGQVTGVVFSPTPAVVSKTGALDDWGESESATV